jgi:thiamine biosynthesis lipoprotein
MLKTQIKLTILFLLITFFIVPVVYGKTYVSQQEIVAGTFVKITIEPIKENKKVLDEAFIEMKRIEKIFSIYDKDSEISQLNRLKKLKVSDDTIFLLKKSFYISSITNGAFDITCKPLIKLYKKAEKRNSAPTKNEIEETLKSVGWEKIILKGNVVEIPENFEIDLGGIAKGYMVDKVVEFLKKKDVKNGMVNAGGDIFAFGKNSKGKDWQIGIQHPLKKRYIQRRVGIRNSAIATSGTYERFYSIKGKKYGHIINPLTGKTVQGFPLSVTVVASDCATADGFATAFFVLGAKKSLQIIQKANNIGAFIIDGNRKIYESNNFTKLSFP